MKIQVKIIKENPDGSANAQVDFDKAGLETLVQWGLVSLLTKAIDEYAIKPENDEVFVQPKRKKVNEPLFTGNLASNKPKISRTRSKK
jgi:hypothetical protein